MEKKITLKQIAMVGVMAAAVYVASAFLQIPIPTAIDNTSAHGECYVSAFRLLLLCKFFTIKCYFIVQFGLMFL